ncbi:MAG: hypothetical protein ACERKO_09470 [Acetanaerobacterium sp.]
MTYTIITCATPRDRDNLIEAIIREEASRRIHLDRGLEKILKKVKEADPHEKS